MYLAIAFCWLFSLCLSLPLVFGFNADTERYLLEEHHCGIYSPTYMFGSSIFAFFLPLLFMSLIYGCHYSNSIILLISSLLVTFFSL